MAAVDPWSWYTEIPVVSRVYLTASFVTTAACALDLVSPFALYYNFSLIFHKGQLWRLATNFFFFGMFSLDFLFHLYFLVRYCRLLEEGEFRGRTLDFVVMLGFGAGVMLLFAPLLSVHFLGSSLAFMMVYVWGRRNDAVRMSFLGLFPFTAPYLPWVLLAFSVLLGNPATTDLVGIAVGHAYYYLEYVYPKLAEIRGFRLRRVIVVPERARRALSGQPRPRRPAPFVPPPDLAGADAGDGAADDGAADGAAADPPPRAHQD